MPPRLVMSQFGPLQQVDLELKDIMIFLGPQATGKSTITKAVYFFKTIRDDLFRLLFEILKGNYDDDGKPILTKFSKLIRDKFLEYWGASYNLTDFQLDFYYSSNSYILLKKEKNFIDPIYSDEIKTTINDLFSKIINYKEKYELPLRYKTSAELLKFDSDYNDFLLNIKKDIDSLFQDERDLIFIPAGRSLLSILSDQIIVLESSKLDYLTKSFINRIQNIRNFFKDDLNRLLEIKSEYIDSDRNNTKIKQAIDIIKSIIQGTFISDRKGDRIYFSPDKYIKLNYASSGQQEALWIVLLIFLLILENKTVSIVIEEPEAHLYPESQKLIVDLIALLLNNNTDNQIFITTHTPYILSAMNNLLYAYQLGQKKYSDVDEIISKEYWINPDRLGVFFVTNGTLTDIIDKETKLIETYWIDQASELVNSIFDELFNLE